MRAVLRIAAVVGFRQVQDLNLDFRALQRLAELLAHVEVESVGQHGQLLRQRRGQQRLDLGIDRNRVLRIEDVEIQEVTQPDQFRGAEERRSAHRFEEAARDFVRLERVAVAGDDFDGRILLERFSAEFDCERPRTLLDREFIVACNNIKFSHAAAPVDLPIA